MQAAGAVEDTDMDMDEVMEHEAVTVMVVMVVMAVTDTHARAECATHSGTPVLVSAPTVLSYMMSKPKTKTPTWQQKTVSLHSTPPLILRSINAGVSTRDARQICHLSRQTLCRVTGPPNTS